MYEYNPQLVIFGIRSCQWPRFWEHKIFANFFNNEKCLRCELKILSIVIDTVVASNKHVLLVHSVWQSVNAKSPEFQQNMMEGDWLVMKISRRACQHEKWTILTISAMFLVWNLTSCVAKQLEPIKSAFTFLKEAMQLQSNEQHRHFTGYSGNLFWCGGQVQNQLRKI